MQEGIDSSGGPAPAAGQAASSPAVEHEHGDRGHREHGHGEHGHGDHGHMHAGLAHHLGAGVGVLAGLLRVAGHLLNLRETRRCNAENCAPGATS